MKCRKFNKWIMALLTLYSCNAFTASAQYSSQLDLTNTSQYPVTLFGIPTTAAADIVRFDLGSGWDGNMDIQLTTGDYSNNGTMLGFAVTTEPNDTLYNDPGAFLTLFDLNTDVRQFFNDNVAGWELYSYGSNNISPNTSNDITAQLNATFRPELHYYAFVAGGSTLSTTVAIDLDVSDGNEVSAVPVPAAVWLFGSGLIGFVSLNNRKKRVTS